MKKRLASFYLLIVGLVTIVLPMLVVLPSNTARADAATAQAAVKEYRTLFYFDRCLKNSVDANGLANDGNGKNPEFESSDEIFKPGQIIAVGIDFDDPDNGVMTCLTVAKKAAAYLMTDAEKTKYGGESVDVWLQQNIWGKSIKGNNGNAIKVDEFREALVKNHVAQLRRLIPSFMAIAYGKFTKAGFKHNILKRLSPMYQQCFDKFQASPASETWPEGSITSKNHKVYARMRDFDWDEIKPVRIKGNDGFNSATNAEVGDIELDFQPGAGGPGNSPFNEFDNISSHWFPIGQDMAFVFDGFNNMRFENELMASCNGLALILDYVFDAGSNGTDPHYKITNNQLKIDWDQNSDGVISDTEREDAPSASVDNSGGNNDPASQDCNIQGVLGWVLNPICDVAIKFTNTAGKYIVNALEVKPLSESDPPGVYETWKLFRDVANAFLVVAFLIAIFAQVLPFELDPYMVKKVLPKLIIAAIGIQFSFFICSIMVDISNVLGHGVEGIINQGIEVLTRNGIATKPGGAGAVAGLIAVGVTGVVITLAFIGPILLLLLSGLIAILTMLISIQARQLVLISLALVSPLAILAWVLPNTEQYAKKWSQNYIKLLLMYPLISFILNGARLLHASLSASYTAPLEAGATLEASNIQQIMINFIPVIALFMVPATFKASGAIMGAISNYGFGKSRSVSKRAGSMAKQQSTDWSREKGAKLLAGENKFGRGVGRVMTGNVFSMGKKGQRKINALVGDVRSQQAKDADEYLKEVAPDNPALRDLLRDGRDKNGKKIDAITRQQALDRLMKNGGWPEYAELYNDVVDADGKFDAGKASKKWGVSSKEATQIWRRAHEGPNGAAAIGKGFRYTDGYKGVDNADATTLAGYRKEVIMDWMQRKIASGQSQEVMDKMGQIMSNKDLRDKLTPEVLKVVSNPTVSNDLIRHSDPSKEAANLARAQSLATGLSGGTITFTDSTGTPQTMSFADFLTNHVNSTGGTQNI